MGVQTALIFTVRNNPKGFYSSFMSNLVILESPYKINTIKNFLGSGYKVVASVGHVRDLPKSQLGVDIENGFQPHYINIRGKGDIISSIRKDAKNATRVYLATDPDREGEAIAWHLAQTLGIPDEKIVRITFNEITKTAVKNAIQHPRPLDLNLVDAQQTRRILDRIVGYKISPLLWKNVMSGLSAGRVQSVAARIITEREEEIANFKPEEYWTIHALLDCGGTPLRVHFYGTGKKKIKLGNGETVRKVLEDVQGKDFEVIGVTRSQKKKVPTPPFTTSTLQQEASRKLGFQSQRIMRVAQELYEGVNLGTEFGGVMGLITYMRTDSLRVSEEAQQSAKDFILAKYGPRYYPDSPRVYKTQAAAQDAHEAIRPTHIDLEPQKLRKLLSLDQYRLYKLIWDRFIASQMESASIDTVTASFQADNYIFRATGTHVAFSGYMALYEETKEEMPVRADSEEAEETDAPLPGLVKGESYHCQSILPEQHFTEAPPSFTEGSLIKFLEEKGIGRPSTYTPIITTIVARDYVSRQGKYLIPTELGKITTTLMKQAFPKIVDYQFTAGIETELDRIERGEIGMEEVLRTFWKDFEKQLSVAEKSIQGKTLKVVPEETDIICDQCGSRMVLRTGRFGKFAACPNYPACKNTKSLTESLDPAPKVEPVIADFRCEKCGAPMVLRNGRYGTFYACSTYPACSFTKQKTAEVSVPCPRCGSKILTKYSRSHVPFYACERFPECQFSCWDKPSEEKCPQCGKMLFIKKTKKQLYCRDRNCGYFRDMSDTEQDEENK